MSRTPGGLGRHGGRGRAALPSMFVFTEDPDVKAAVRRAWDGGKVVAAFCHGPGRCWV